MLLRRCTAVIAIVGVLLHSMALVRHHAVMLTEALLPSASTEDARLGDAALPFLTLSICRGSAAGRSADLEAARERGNEDPAPSPQGAPCPICSGGVAAFAVAPPFVTLVFLPSTGLAGSPEPPAHPLDVERRARPPARGPPVSA
jgi:hypothetical protein